MNLRSQARKQEKAARLREIEVILERIPHRLEWMEELGQVPGDFGDMVRKLASFARDRS